MKDPAYSQGQRLHMLYCAITHYAVQWNFSREYAWGCWLVRGWTEDDLRATLVHLLRLVKRGDKSQTCLQFSRLIADLDQFEEYLVEARAVGRTRQATPRQMFLSQTGRPEAEPDNTRHAGEIAKAITSDPEAARRALEDFRKFKESL